MTRLKSTPLGRFTNRDSLGLSLDNLGEKVAALKKGLPFARLLAFVKKSGLTWEEIAAVVRLPARTLARRKTQGVLTDLESERLARLAGLFDKAVALFEGDAAAAQTWLRTPAMALDNQTPLSWATTEMGGRAVEELIGRLEHGVFS